MGDLVQLIKNSHSGTDVHDIDGYDGPISVTPMWKQVAGIKAKMLPIMEKATDGVNLICYSQGELKVVRLHKVNSQLLVHSLRMHGN